MLWRAEATWAEGLVERVQAVVLGVQQLQLHVVAGILQLGRRRLGDLLDERAADLVFSRPRRRRR